MTHIQYAGVLYPLPPVTGTYLCDAIEIALLRGHTFFVELGPTAEAPGLMRALLFAPSIPVELARLALDLDTYRQDIVEALLDLAAAPAKRMWFIGVDIDRDDVDEFGSLIAAAAAEVRG